MILDNLWLELLLYLGLWIVCTAIASAITIFLILPLFDA